MTADVVPFTEHLLRWNSNKDRLSGFADRVAELRKDLIGLLSQQATQQPWKHADALATIEPRLAPNRAFYGSIYDANEEIARAFTSKHGGESAVQIVSWELGCPVIDTFVLTYDCWAQNAGLLKQLAGAVGGGITQRTAGAIKESAGSTLKEYQEKITR